MTSLFLSGIIFEFSTKVEGTILAEVCRKDMFEKLIIFVSMGFVVSEIIVGPLYLLLKNWRLVVIVFTLIPQLLLLIFSVFYLKESPKILAENHSAEKAVK